MPRHFVFFSQKQIITFLMILVIIGGFYSYREIQVALFPEVTFPKIKLIAENGEQPTEKMMITVTKPLENAIKQVKDLKLIRSTTARGSCEISAYFDWNSDIDRDQANLESKINQIAGLPPDIAITTEKMNPAVMPVMNFSLESSDR